MKYAIYQLKREFNNKLFARYSLIEKFYGGVNIEEYNNLYEGEIEGESELDACENVYKKFNLNRPEDFKGHSLSMSDIVKVNENYYYCDSFGFKKI